MQSFLQRYGIIMVIFFVILKHHALGYCFKVALSFNIFYILEIIVFFIKLSFLTLSKHFPIGWYSML